MAVRKKKEVYLTKEPDWTRLQKSANDEQKLAAFKHADFFVHYEIETKAKASAMRLWIKTASDWDIEDQKIVNKLPDYFFVTAGKIAFMTKKLGFIPKMHLDYLTDQLPIWIKASNNLKKDPLAEEEETAPVVKKPGISIQARMAEQVLPLCGDWEAILDLVVDGGFNLDKFDPYNDMRAYESGVIKANHAKIIKDMYSRDYEEAIDVVKWQDDDIKEAYSHLDTKARKLYLAFHEKINTACDTFITTGKAQRKTRKPKAVSKEKLVTKLKYKVNDGELGVSSINPIDIIDARELWMYNTKSRKIIHIVAANPGPGLSVKGSGIQNFLESSSLQKTLRKPLEQLKDFKGGARTKYMKAFDDIKTTETKSNGRVNEHCIILKSF